MIQRLHRKDVAFFILYDSFLTFPDWMNQQVFHIFVNTHKY